ncbi:MAG: hypothetical protein QNJ11_02055 [Woeseiaceae bacterium]|nr:hypothetical protein [Woeseiaceae bacterium]
MRFLEIWDGVASEVIDAADKVIGQNGYLYREWDDEDIDVLIPDRQWLSKYYPNTDVDWLLESHEQFFKLEEEAFYSIPSNPSEIDVRTGFYAFKMALARPGEAHPCPRCGESFVSKFSARQCRNQECGYAYFPFESIEDATSVIDVPLDASGVGTCQRERGTHGRCGQWRKFTKRIEQCACGQMLRGFSGRHSLDLKDNEEETARILEIVGKDLRARYGASYSRPSPVSAE